VKFFIPTPSLSAVALGPLTVHFYAVCILIGVIGAIIVGRNRYSQLGGNANEITDVAIFAIPAGIIGGRLYHVITSPDRYFGISGHPLDALKIWDGGMGIWGAIGLGTLVSFLVFRKSKESLGFGSFADALAPGILIAQGIGRFGNWFNGELFGGPTTLPWGLEIPTPLRPAGYENFLTFHPTFLYEALWCFLAAFLIMRMRDYFSQKPGTLFYVYIALYCLGRSGIEALRIDEAHHLFGLRVNEWVSLIGLLCATLVVLTRLREIKKGRIAP